MIILCTLLVAAVSAAPQFGGARPAPQQGEPIPIIRLVNDGVNADGSYEWSYETGNGIQAQEQGAIKGSGPEGDILSAQGSFAYTADDGTPIQLSYVADENGFQPQGAHLPTPPPIPPAIQRALEWNAAHPEQDGDTGAATGGINLRQGRK